MTSFPGEPSPPDWRVEWEALNRLLPCLETMRGCPQDHVHHAEGDVWTHTRMVIEALTTDSDWRERPDMERRLTFADRKSVV